MTATTTRRKQQQEMILRALRAEEERKRVGRENFPLTTVSVAQLAAYEPALHHVNEEHEEGKLELNSFIWSLNIADNNCTASDMLQVSIFSIVFFFFNLFNCFYFCMSHFY